MLEFLTKVSGSQLPQTRGAPTVCAELSRTFVLAASVLTWLIAAPVAAEPGPTLRHFQVDMVPDEQMHLVTSNGTGHVEMSLDVATMELSWRIEHKNLTSPATGAGLYGPAQLGTNGVLILDLAPRGMTMPLTGSAAITEDTLQYFISGWSYVSLQTEKYPMGEIRGQVILVPPWDVETASQNTGH